MAILIKKEIEMKISEIWEVKLPYWSLSALVNADTSGLTSEEIDLIDRFEAKINDYANHTDTTWHLSLNTYEKEYQRHLELIQEEIEFQFENGIDLKDIEGLMNEGKRLFKIKDETCEPYFTGFPKFGAPCSVYDAEIIFMC